MSPGGGDSVPAGAAPEPAGALEAGALEAAGDVGPVAGELAELLHAAAPSPAAATNEDPPGHN
jgi:hypothetical protein